MDIKGTGCCAVQEIVHLRDHDNTAEAMAEFCKQTYTSQTYDYNTSAYIYRLNPRAKLHGHYTFTGVIGYKDRKERSITYAPNFAAFIRTHQLGAVVGGKAEYNRTNHPTHLVRVWIWTPNPVNVKAWYKKYKKEHP